MASDATQVARNSVIATCQKGQEMSLIATFWAVPEVAVEALLNAAQPEEHRKRHLFLFSKVERIDRFPELLAELGISYTFDEGGDCFLALEMYLAGLEKVIESDNLFDNETSRQLSRARGESWWVIDPPEAKQTLAILRRSRPTPTDLLRFLKAEYHDASPDPEPILHAYDTLVRWLASLQSDHRGFLHVG